MNDLINKLASMPWPRVLIAAAVVAGLYWQFGLEAGVTDEQFASAESSKTQAQASLESTQKAVADLKKFREELDNMHAQFQQVVELMPADANVAAFMLLIREEATKSGARVKKLEPQKDVQKVNFYETRKLDISLEGSYSQVLTFLSNLSRLKRLITVDKLEIAQAAGGEDAKVSFNGTLVSYRYLSQQPAVPATPDSGAAPAPTPAGGH